MDLYPYTDETPEERRRLKAGPLILTSPFGKSIFVGKVEGDEYSSRNDVTVFVPDDQEWTCTLEGSPDDTGRAFVFKSVQEVQDTVAALNRALVIIREEVAKAD
jgi:hypothetical protein